MASVFVILADPTSTQLSEKIKEVFEDNYYTLSDKQWLVAGDMLTMDVMEKLGAGQGALGRIVIFKIDSYSGWHATDMWEWLKLKWSA